MKNLIWGMLIAISILIGLNSCKTTTTDSVVHYELARNYFIRNDVSSEPPALIHSQSEFERNFGMATTMGENGQPTTIDFTKQNAICVSVPETHATTDISIKSVTDSAGVLTVRYKVDYGKIQSYSSHPFLLLIVDKKYGDKVRLINLSSSPFSVAH